MAKAVTNRQTPGEIRAEILAEVMAENERLNEAKAGHRRVLAELRAEVDRLRAEHDVAVKEARRTLQAAPPAPELPDGQEHRNAITSIEWAQGELTGRRTRALADAAPDVSARWQATRAVLDERARAIAAEAEALAREYAAWWSLLSEVRGAEEQRNPNRIIRNGPSTRMRPRPTAASVLDAANGADLCGVLSMHVTRTPVTGAASDGSGRAVADPGPERVASDADGSRFGSFLSKVE